jgi:uncharacterized protein YmfQ (DUF2313 family)
MRESALRGLDGDAYLAAVQALLPTGPAWPREPAANLTRYWAAVAAELARHHVRALDLLIDASPAQAVELLADWERVADLPDVCSGAEIVGLVARRAALIQRLTSLGGQSRSYFIGVAASLGYTITITEYRAFVAGSSAGQSLTNGTWPFAWRVNSPAVTVRNFVAGSGAGEPLRSWGNTPLECAIRRLAPAHTLPIFAYGG